MSALNQSGWKPEMGPSGDAVSRRTFTGNRALMLEEALIFEIGDDRYDRRRLAGRLAMLPHAWVVWNATARSGFPACPNRKRSATTPD
jgi:hypothetical protein